MAIRMQQRRGTSTQWTNANPVLGEGEIGWESNTNKFKIGDGVNEWADLPYFLDEDTLAGSIDDYIPLTQKGAANGVATLDSGGKLVSSQIPTIDELAQDAVDTALTAGTGITKTYNDNANTITIAVDTSTIAPLAGPTFTGTVTLPSTTSVGDVSSTELGYVNGVTSAIQTQLDAKAPTASPTFTGTVSGITATMVGLGNVDNTSDANKPVSTATQTALDLKANLAGPTFTGTVTLPSTTSIGDVSATEISYVNGVTSAIQTQLDGKAASSHTHPQSDITNLTTDLAAKLSLAGGTMTGALTLAAAPTQALEAATKAYVDAVSEGLHIHASCVAATTANVDISTALEPGDVVDGVTLVQGDRVLVKNQTNAAQNGIYVVQASGAALRASDFNEPQEVDGGDFVFVTGGTLGDNTGWVQTTTNVVTIGTDPIVFTQFSGAGTYQAGTGLTLTDNIFSINTATTVDTGTAQTLTNKTIALGNNTVSGTLAQFNTAVTDADLASVAGAETLTNKTIALGNNTISGTLAQFNTAVTDADLAPTASPAFTGTVTLPSTTSIGNVSSTELGYLDGVTSAIQTQLDGKAATAHTHAISDVTNLQTSLDAKAPTASPTFTGTVTLPSTTSIGTVSSTELGYLDGVTSNIQTQINNISPDPMPQVFMMMGA